MSFYIAAVAKRFPKVAPLHARLVARETPMDKLREEIWTARAEYWFRKFESIPGTWNTAKGEACEVVKALKNPWSITYKQIATALVYGVQIVGCFCLGEMIARRDIRGYDSAVGIAKEEH